ncbi:hypothetical protein BB561_004999 [Smittium simulii]|uniref:Uncharacterized protein n=1 Tax=Smittium simulii TaxID=133385 RepID=A0A2T9YCX0_9FUNG|nr:hypothetical protein BB561_004999 [Smittium simulii]
MDTLQVQKITLKSGLNLTKCQVKSSAESQYNVLNMGHMLDHNTQFLGDIDAAIDHTATSIDGEYVSYQHEKTAKITFFMLYIEESAEKCMNTPIYYNGIAVSSTKL